ncbi:hypothetical protein GQ44DRAFT_440826 [Phaeosphaeriaceae sp. PMI808]|nr:hypothetical protein GQ44DRAFT_440826 [Phaeosphaeriaceae sp. PMI808]
MFTTRVKATCRAIGVSPNGLTSLLQKRRPQSTLTDGDHYWRQTPWRDASIEKFNSWPWQLSNTVSGATKLERFLSQVLPENLGPSADERLQKIQSKQDFIDNALAATKHASMAIRLTPHILSRVDWNNPLDDPIRKQFIPLDITRVPDHDQLTLDSLHEEEDSPVPGLVHRYPGRALFLATSICPVYCRFCTRSYAVGGSTDLVQKRPQRPSRKRWEEIFKYIESHPDLQDIVVSGGDSYYLQGDELREIGERLLGMPNIKRIRFASKGLAIAPGRIQQGEPWTEALIALSKQGRKQGKQVCLHTHINHANEITWVTKKASNYLFEHGVIVRNQSVLLKGVNNSYEALSELIKALSDINIQPYYVYQCDMVKGIEELRTPLHEIISLDKKIRGTFSGFMMPSFVVDLPGGGGKRLVSTFETYNKGVAVYTAPGLDGDKSTRLFTYHDPKPVKDYATEHAALQQPEKTKLKQLTAETLENDTILKRLENPPFSESPSNELPGRIPIHVSGNDVKTKPVESKPVENSRFENSPFAIRTISVPMSNGLEGNYEHLASTHPVKPLETN